jgi:hypothetical protein
LVVYTSHLSRRANTVLFSIFAGKSSLSPSALQQALAGSGRNVRIDEAAMNGGAGNKANPIYVVVEEGKKMD